MIQPWQGKGRRCHLVTARWVYKSTFFPWPSLTPEGRAGQRSKFPVPNKSPLIPFWLGGVGVCLATAFHMASTDKKGGGRVISLALGGSESLDSTKPPLKPLQQEGAGMPHYCWVGVKVAPTDATSKDGGSLIST